MTNAEISIRKARSADLDRIADIEIDAYPIWSAACNINGDASATPRKVMISAIDAGLVFVAVNENDCAIGFVAATELGGGLYVGEIDVEAAWQGKGIGRRLMQTILAEGKHRSLSFATLTTDRFAPFNAPFYSQLGFVELPETELPEFLKLKLRSEIEGGLDPTRRVAMRISL